MVRRLRSVGGVLLIVVGLLGFLLPVIPGVPLLMAGVALLGRDHRLVRPALDWLGRLREKWRGRRRALSAHQKVRRT
jgi:uncharacterized membrane protein YbaN (DUF454 family)